LLTNIEAMSVTIAVLPHPTDRKAAADPESAARNVGFRRSSAVVRPL
jgi:hypothetical protein